MPNAVSGYVYDTLNRPIRDARVIARRIVIVQQGYEVLSQHEVETNRKGHYHFSAVEAGQYVITIEYEDKKVIIPFVEISRNDTVNLGVSVPQNTLSAIKGRVVNAANNSLVVTVPGINTTTTTDAEGFYVLERVPAQVLRLVFIGSESVNYLHINISPSADTAFIRDVFYATNIDYARGYELSHFSGLSNSFSIIPVEYDSANVPLWYGTRDFGRVDYLLLRNSSYNFTASSGMWSDPRSWNLLRVPRYGDTAVISGKTCFVLEDTISAILHTDEGAEIMLSNNIFFRQAIFSNSTISLTSDSIRVLISGDITFRGENYLNTPKSSIIFYQSIRGTGIINVGGTIQLDSIGASAFVGDWNINAGRLRVRSASGTGVGVVTVGPGGNLDIEHPQALDGATLVRLVSGAEQYTILELDNNIIVDALEIDGVLMPAGVYTRETHPNFMRGTGSITVE